MNRDRPDPGRVVRTAVGSGVRRLGFRLRNILEHRSRKKYTAPTLPELTRASGLAACRLSVARGLCHISTLCDQARDRRDALSIAAAAVRIAPFSSAAWTQLSVSALRGGPRCMVVHDVLGVVDGRCGDTRLALEAASTAASIDRTDAAALMQLGTSALAADDPEAATSALEAAIAASPQNAEAWFRLGRIPAREAARRGYFTADDFERHGRLLEAALDADPLHGNARYHLTRVALRATDWRRALAGSLPPGVPAPPALLALMQVAADDPLSSILTELEDLAASRVGLELGDAWLVAYWKMISIGAVSRAFRFKDTHAHHVRRRHETDASMTGLIARCRASVCLADYARAKSDLAIAGAASVDNQHRSIIDKLESDVALLTGDPALHRAAPVVTATPVTERTFEQRIRGQRVAIVGPSRSGPCDSSGIDADVVITTLSTGLGMASPDDALAHAPDAQIAYASNWIASGYASQIRDLLGIGRLEQVEIRPSAVELTRSPHPNRNHLRCVPTENAALLEATHFAIPRIIYDVLRYEPDSISVFNADLFAGGRQYHDRYQTVASAHERLPGYGHDLRADHRWLQTLLGEGLIRAAPDLEFVLGLSTGEYLEATSSPEGLRA